MRGRSLSLLLVAGLAVVATAARSQIIEFESNGMDYQVQTRSGLTVMCAPMPLRTGRYAVMHVAISNGSGRAWEVAAEDFAFEYADGSLLRAVPEREVIVDFFRKAGRSELMKLQAAYEKALYNNQFIRPSNSYEKRRLSALAIGPKGIKASAAAAAIAFVSGKIASGDSADGAVFLPAAGRALDRGRVVATLEAERFEFLPR